MTEEVCICSILGMHLFGGKLCEHPDGRPCTCAEVNNATVKCKSERKNFDSLLWSLVTVFQVYFSQCGQLVMVIML